MSRKKEKKPAVLRERERRSLLPLRERDRVRFFFFFDLDRERDRLFLAGCIPILLPISWCRSSAFFLSAASTAGHENKGGRDCAPPQGKNGSTKTICQKAMCKSWNRQKWSSIQVSPPYLFIQVLSGIAFNLRAFPGEGGWRSFSPGRASFCASASADPS